MAGLVTRYIKIYEANDQAYRDTKRKEMKIIINSEDRFSKEKGQLFIASVKGLIDKWLPWEGCTIAEEKKLLGSAFESLRESIIYLAPKCHSAIDSEIDDVRRMKGVNEKNSDLIRSDYINCIENNSNISGRVTQILLKNGVMSMVKITKSALTRVVDKMIVIDCDISKGQSYPCAPQIFGVDASSYHYV
ncbi:MAG: hypothetical protein EZS28_031777 [Streblomastix strix]|uniref:Uncharacterized protein n=1 Tax=Streblomastix strix TaxID=222440 RepID=A0A5J4USC0_9EUKA|nr:MAG: hypothetical protein EZS28_031777 [Streblomastix strix]